MAKLGIPYPQELAIDIFIHYLTDAYKHFRLNFYMQGGEVTMQELHGMLLQAERSLPAKPNDEHKDVLMVRKEKQFKKHGAPANKDKGKGKMVAQSNTPENPKAKTKTKVAAEHECFYCHKKGHWKRNCPKYLEDKKMVLLPQELKRSRTLTKGKVDIHVGKWSKSYCFRNRRL